MKFGIFYELSVPRPWDKEAERKVYMNALEQVRLADELGFDQVWAVEHHFLEEYSHCSSPELFLTACAMQTTRIRVGHGAHDRARGRELRGVDVALRVPEVGSDEGLRAVRERLLDREEHPQLRRPALDCARGGPPRS